MWDRWTSVAAAVVLGLGCSATSYFACEQDSECANVEGGQCEVAGACSFPDDDCDSGRRYGNEGPPHLAGECVPGGGATGGVGTTTLGWGSLSSEGSASGDGEDTTAAVDDGGSSTSGAGTSTGGLGSEPTTSSGDTGSGDSGGSSSTGGVYPPGSQEIYEPCAESADCASGRS